ncbi:Cin10p Ecym_2317 [Eremothecium cymbalariae DBVPG|uniref:Major facilitator superfamily (MFS) profile domain-containing protein n=1 Tax=Eremothecium cymbalariae (strain CBS 270.75 / DBVPG 7215 / KCTC 17166 / NRRL Y-17582) TaxID=931890 RepID=G8JQ57_ERECY|nr:Hypothetical protein Ecym_2317 [Eremothecium cymbalariae DBVPG\
MSLDTIRNAFERNIAGTTTLDEELERAGNSYVHDSSHCSVFTDTTSDDIDHVATSVSCRTGVAYGAAIASGLVIGYQIGVIAAVFISLKAEHLGLQVLSDFTREVVTSVTCIGCVVGSVCWYFLTDRYGRKPILLSSGFVIVFSSVIMALSNSLEVLVCGRLISGVAVGVAAQCTPAYWGEISPASLRGSIMASQTVALAGAQVIAYLISVYFMSKDVAWRYLFGIGVVPAMILLLFLAFIPESPKWLVMKARINDAEVTIRKLYPHASTHQVQVKVKKLVHGLAKLRSSEDETEPLIERRGSRRSCIPKQYSGASVNYPTDANTMNTRPFSEESSHGRKRQHDMEARTKRALTMACILMFLQQILGINAFMCYSPVIFAKMGAKSPWIPSLFVAITKFTFACISIKYTDKVGKRMMLLCTTAITTISLVMCHIGIENGTFGLIVTAMLICIASYASAMETIPWSSVEFLPLNRRSFGSVCISCTNWLTNSIVCISFLTVTNYIGCAKSALIFAFFSILNWIFVYNRYPEIKGLTLEEIGTIFEDGIDVNYIYRNYH